MLIAASTAEVLIPAIFGLIGTIVGALISRAIAVSQHRAGKDADARLAGAKCVSALDELRRENSPKNVRCARARLTELGYAAISSGVDLRLAHGAMRFGSQNIDFYADPGHREAMRADPLERAADSAAALIAAVDTVPYRRRRGPFMDPGMNEKADKFNVEHEMFNRIRERPYTGPMWQLARFLETLRRFKRWILDILRHFKRWTEDLFSGNRQQG